MKIFSRTVLVLFSLLYSNFTFSQGWYWAKGYSGSDSDKGLAIARTANGTNTIAVTGVFSSPTVGIGTSTLINSGGPGTSNMFLAKLDQNGNPYWAINSRGNGLASGNSVCFDNFNNIIVAGSYTGSWMAIETNTIFNTGGEDIFYAKFDPAGNLIWLRTFVSNGNERAFIANDPSLNLLHMTGFFTGANMIAFNYTLSSAGGADIFVAKIDLVNGLVNIINSYGGTGDDKGFSIVGEWGNSYVTGSFTSPTLSIGSNTLTNGGIKSIFIAGFNFAVSPVWAKTAICAGNSEALAITYESALYITGYYDVPSIIFGTNTLTSQTGTNVFVARYDYNAGNLIWAKTPGGASGNLGYSIGGANGDIYVSGALSNSMVTFDSYSLTAPVGSTDPMFLVRYNGAGIAQWADVLASGGNSKNALVSDGNKTAYITGGFELNPFTIGSHTLTLGGNQNIFVANYYKNPFPPPVALEEQTKEKYGNLIFPNPINKGEELLLNIDGGEIEELVVMDSYGQILLRHDRKNSEGLNAINSEIKKFASGIYFVRIIINGTLYNQKLIIQ